MRQEWGQRQGPVGQAQQDRVVAVQRQEVQYWCLPMRQAKAWAGDDGVDSSVKVMTMDNVPLRP